MNRKPRPLLRRRRLILDRFQYWLLGYNLLYMACLLALFVIFVFLPPLRVLESPTATPQQMDQAAASILDLHARIWGAVLVVLILVSIHSVRITHRIAGPLHRFREVFDAMADGDLRTLAHIRRKDYLRREAEAINHMIVGLRARLAGVAKSLDVVERNLPTLDECKRGMATGDFEEAIAYLSTALDASRAEIQQFMLPLDGKTEPARAPGTPSHRSA